MTEKLVRTRISHLLTKLLSDFMFKQEQELQTKSARLAELNALLNMDKRENEGVDSVADEEPELPERKAVNRER